MKVWKWGWRCGGAGEGVKSVEVRGEGIKGVEVWRCGVRGWRCRVKV